MMIYSILLLFFFTVVTNFSIAQEKTSFNITEAFDNVVILLDTVYSENAVLYYFKGSSKNIYQYQWVDLNGKKLKKKDLRSFPENLEKEGYLFFSSCALSYSVHSHPASSEEEEELIRNLRKQCNEGCTSGTTLELVETFPKINVYNVGESKFLVGIIQGSYLNTLNNWEKDKNPYINLWIPFIIPLCSD